MNYDLYCTMVQYLSLLYFDVVLLVWWFFPKGKLISTHQFLDGFWTLAS